MGSTLTRQLDGGTTELMGFFGDMFGVTHVPSGPPKGGVVVCSPVYSEFLKNNRREVLLGRKLAEHGYAVQRFHYRGTGNSQGEASGLTVESMAEDAARACERLTEVTGVAEPDMVSTRLASLPAASVARASSRLVMWEPVGEGRKYFRELTRSLLILGVKQGVSRSAGDLEAEFETTGALDIAGFSVAKALRDTAVVSRLQIPDGEGEALIIQLGRSLETRKDLATVASLVEDAGRKAEVQALQLEEAWWFHQDVNLLRPEEGALLDDALVESTVDWLTGGTS